MKEPGTRLALQTVLLLVLFGFAPPLRAHVLDVCNNGTVSVVVVTAMKNADLARGLGKYYWAITSTAVPPGKGKSVYSDMAGEGAYLGFGFEDAKGQWGSRQSRPGAESRGVYPVVSNLAEPVEGRGNDKCLRSKS